MSESDSSGDLFGLKHIHTYIYTYIIYAYIHMYIVILRWAEVTHLDELWWAKVTHLRPDEALSPIVIYDGNIVINVRIYEHFHPP